MAVDRRAPLPARARAAAELRGLDPVTGLALLRAVWGAVLLLRPRAALRAMDRRAAGSAPAVTVARVLGGRHLVQAGVTVWRPSGVVPAAGVMVDLLHGGSALGFAALDGRHRRAWLTSAAGAGALAALGVAALGVAAGGVRPRRTGRRSALPATQAGAGAVESAGENRRTQERTQERTQREGTTMHADHRGSTRDEARPEVSAEQSGRRSDRPEGQRSAMRSTLVRPRPMWAGVLLLLAGMLLVGWAVIETSVAWAVPGIAVLAVGTGLAWWGGVLADMQSTQPLDHELEAAKEGERHEGVDAGEMIHDPKARRTARRLDRQRRDLEARADAARPRWQPVLRLALLLLGAWLAIGTFALAYPYTVEGQNAVNRALGGAAVLMLCALWLRHVGPSKVAAGLAFLAGVGLVLAAVLLPHDVTRSAYQEGIVGALAVLAAAGVLVGRPR